MENRILLFLSLSALIVCSCSVHQRNNPHAKETPGCVPINETLLCDQTEINNFHWLEYMYWTGKAYGTDSEQYKAILPDTTVWGVVTCDSSRINAYLRHPERRDSPLVGITQEQAMAFSKWRSDRVFEYTLIKKGVLRFNNKARGDACFTIEKYFAGTYYCPMKKGDTVLQRIVPDLSIPYPQYRLPNATERLLVLDYIDSTDFIFHQKKARKYAKWRENNVPFLLAQEPCINDSLASEPTRIVTSSFDNRNAFGLIHNARGNVAEWGAEPNMTYGGGWPHNVEYILSKDTVSVPNQNAWTGFRNVCEWQYWEDKN